ncbi:MAG: hypothetical protein AAGI23_10125 [Bacteroidota bacterium]
MPNIFEFLPYYTLGFLSLVAIITILFFFSTRPKKWAYFYYAVYSLSMGGLILRDVLVIQEQLSDISILVTISVLVETISVIFYALFAYYFIEDVIVKSRQIFKPFIVSCIALMSLYLLIFFTLKVIGVELGTLIKIHQDYHWIIATFGSVGILFFVLRLPTSLMIYILLGSAALAIGSGLTIYMSDPNFLFIVQVDNSIFLNREGCDMTYLQVGILVDTIAFSAAMIKKHQYQRDQLQAAFEEMKRKSEMAPQQGNSSDTYVEVVYNGSKVKLSIQHIIMVHSDKIGRLEIFFAIGKFNQQIQSAFTYEKFNSLKEKLQLPDFFVARNRAPQCIIHRKYIQAVSNTTIKQKSIKYQATATMINGMEVVISKSKKVAFEDWYQL